MLRKRTGDDQLSRLQEENESLRRAVEELTILNDISREIGGLADLDEVLRRIVNKSIAAVGAEEGFITLVDDEVQDTGKTLIRSMATQADRGPFHLNEQIIGWMQLHRRPLCIQRGSNEGLERALTDERVRSLLSVPLLARSRLTGVLTVCNRDHGTAFDEADQRLLSIIASQSAQIIENARLYEEEKALLQMRDELGVAFEIQKRLLPAAPPTLAGYQVAGLTIPAHEVGGDFFDYIPLGTRRLAMCVGDVSGKGLPAALLMASAQATIRGQADYTRSPNETIERVNWQIYRSIKRGSFLTLFYADLDHGEHRMRFVNAGHNRPLLLRKGEVQELAGGGLAIGLHPRSSYELGEVSLEPEDLLLVYSDGITEAMNAEREQFGEDRLRDVMAGCAESSAATTVDCVLAAVRRFCGDTPASDDITILSVSRR
jgi:phosphoserine phosphatase RsbU/P